MTASFNETLHPRESTTGQFATKTNTAPSITLGYSETCTEGCGQPAEYRLENVTRGYRAPGSEPALCGVHALEYAAEGTTIERMPEPQGEGESIVWLIEGDDHETELVEAVTEDEALDIAAERFEDRYGAERDEDDEDEDYDVRDYLNIVGTFRGDIDDTDELTFVPSEHSSENEAYNKLDQHM
ncbi:hypothetical protein [Microbacterium sp. 77mftsu3.1]|uniref:hypothetical protein n=1 Tax=Microbacterium sp. 77mftsu3.1 TaxID=1761802 RepID=UPI00115F8562|nr:hypothetical protein [Microbacterium sp. 77mftsu3.1]